MIYYGHINLLGQSFANKLKKKSALDSDLDEDNDEVLARLKENAVTMNKMNDLKHQMEKLNIRKKKKVMKSRIYILNDIKQYFYLTEKTSSLPL